MNVFFYIYLTIFTFVVVAACVSTFAGKSEDETSTLEHALDLATAVILWTGMLMFAFKFRHAAIQYTWILLAIGSAAYVIVSSWRGRRKELADPESELTQPIIAIADVGVCLMLLPALLINILFGLASV